MDEEFKDQVEMAEALGSSCGLQCWCGASPRAYGYVHIKIFRPYSCGSEECQRLEALFHSLPKPAYYNDEVFG